MRTQNWIALYGIHLTAVILFFYFSLRDNLRDFFNKERRIGNETQKNISCHTWCCCAWIFIEAPKEDYIWS
jgi:hypothetical protein